MDAGIIRAGRGIGIASWQLFFQVRLPLALPMIFTGVRLAVISVLGITTTGVFIGAGGLGKLIWRGIQTRNMTMMLSGAIPCSLLVVCTELFLYMAEKILKHNN